MRVSYSVSSWNHETREGDFRVLAEFVELDDEGKALARFIICESIVPSSCLHNAERMALEAVDNHRMMRRMDLVHPGPMVVEDLS